MSLSCFIHIVYLNRNYSVLSLRFLWILKALHPAVRMVFDRHGVFSTTGEPFGGVAMDAFMEMVV